MTKDGPSRRRLSPKGQVAAVLSVVLVASGTVLLWPGNPAPVSAPRSEVAAAPSAVPATAVPSTAVAAETPSGSPPAPSVAATSTAAKAVAPAQSRTVPGGTPVSKAVRRRAQASDPPAPPWTLEGYAWPLPHGRITDPFGPSPWGSRLVHGQLFHDGIDLATFCGDRVVAAHGGLVLAAGRKFDAMIGWIGDLGPYLARLQEKQLWSTLPITVVIDDGNGYRSVYAHFYRVVVRAGQRVRVGQFLGYEGATGRASGCHLHYGLFAPHEAATFAIKASVAQRMLLPPLQVARIDPLLVLPSRAPDAGLPTTREPGLPHGLGE